MTLFDMMQGMGIVGGAWLGITTGSKEFGVAGAIIGGVLGFVVGHFVGMAPCWIVWAMLRLSYKLTSTARLRKKLQTNHDVDEQLIAELIVRGEPVESFWPYILSSLRSDSFPERYHAWENLNIWFPRIAKQISGFDPAYSVESCRQSIRGIENAGPCAAPLPFEPTVAVTWHDRYWTFLILAILVVIAALFNFRGYGWLIGSFTFIVLFGWKVGRAQCRAASEHPPAPPPS